MVWSKRIVAAVVLALVAAACGGGDDGGAAGPTGTQSTPATGAQTVNMTDQLTFEPATLSIANGATVTWKNVGSAPHTVTAQNSEVESSLDSGNIAGGGEFSHTFTTAGTFSYYCKFHPNMKGTLTIA